MPKTARQVGRPPADDPDLGILLTLALRGFVDLLHEGLGGQGYADLRPAFGVVFRALRDDPLTLTQLAARLGVTKQAASKVVDEMAVKQLVRRLPAPDDARAKLLELTPRGRSAMAAAIALGGAIEQRLRGEAGDDRTDVAREVLATFVRLAGGAEELALRRSRAVW